MHNRKSQIANRKCNRGFAILMVVLVLVGLTIIGAPFAISMREEEHASLNFSARVRAKLAAQGALTWTKAQLERTHQHREHAEPAGIFNTPQVDENGEFQIDLTDASLTTGTVAVETANPAGVIWGVVVIDEQGKINVKTASEALLRNLLRQLFEQARADAVAKSIVDYRGGTRDGDGHLLTSPHQLTTLTQLREIDAALTPAEYDEISRFLTVHSASLVGEVPSHSLALHPVNINTCTEEVLRAILLGIKLKQQAGDPAHEGVTEAEVNALVARLRVFHVLQGTVGPDEADVPLDSTADLPESGWVVIQGDAVKYDSKTAASLHVPDPNEPVAGRIDVTHDTDAAPEDIQVRLLFTDIDTDFAGVLDTLAEEGSLSAQSRSALLANAANPLDGDALEVETTTAPLCFCSFNIYTIEATGVVSGEDGRELARYTIQEVAQIAPSGDLEIRIAQQSEFEASRHSGDAPRTATGPNPTQVSDIPPANTEPTDDEVRTTPAVRVRRGGIGLQAAEYLSALIPTFIARFNGPLTQTTLRADAGTNMPDPIAELTTATCQAGPDGSVKPDGVRVGVHKFEDGTSQKLTLVYGARDDGGGGGDNIPHGGGRVRPFAFEMWVKFDPKDKFDYSKDHFLFDFGGATYTNRVALYYDSTSGTGGDLVLHVCDPTEPLDLGAAGKLGLPAQVRHPITEDTFQSERWYHIAAVIRGIGYNEMALFVDGRSVGHYEPSTALTSNIDNLAPSVPCDGLAQYKDAGTYFSPFWWPPADCVIIGGELVEHIAADGNTLTVGPEGRGARGTQPRRHFTDTPVEIYGYDDPVRRGSWYHSNTEYRLDHLLKDGEAPLLRTAGIPAVMHSATVDDGDDRKPEDDPPAADADITATKTTQYWKPAETKYQAATDLDYTLPSEDWLPVSTSKMWTVPVGEALQEKPDEFKEAAEDDKLLGFLLYNETGQTLAAGTSTIEDAVNGLGFIRVEKNEDDDAATEDDELAGEIIKFSKAGVVLVWRWHPDDLGEEDETKRRKIAWYIGYLGGLGDVAPEEPEEPPAEPVAAPAHQRRGCFATEKHDIMEGATLRFDCLRLSHNANVPRGHREEVFMTFKDPNDGSDQRMSVGFLSGLGIFQVLRGPTHYEWIEFAHPQFEADADEEALLGGQTGGAGGTPGTWFVRIFRSRKDTAKVTGGDDNAGLAFAAAGGDLVMPVFFGHQSRVNDSERAVVKGRNDQVTLIDDTLENREVLVVSHGWGEYFAFRSPVKQTYLYANNPRVLKFPSGNMPAKPDKHFYIGSDGTCHDGDTAKPFTESGSHTTTDPDNATAPVPGEPERPANATFDEVRISALDSYRTARLWDYTKTTDGKPDKTNRHLRYYGKSYDPATSDPAPIAADTAPPFYIRIGHLERLMPKSVPEAFRFLADGRAQWPMEGYLKIDDECMFYRTLFCDRRLTAQGSTNPTLPSAAVVLPDGYQKDPDGLPVALSPSDTTLTIGEGGKDFPEQGYITIHNSWPSTAYWKRIQDLAAKYPGLSPEQIAEWFHQGYPLLGEGGGRHDPNSNHSYPERLFYYKKEKLDDEGKKWKLHFHAQHRGILDTAWLRDPFTGELSNKRWIRFIDTGATTQPSWYLPGYDPADEDTHHLTTSGSAAVRLMSVELLILRRACLGTEAKNHPIGTVALPLTHIPTSLTPRAMVRLKRNEDGFLPLWKDDPAYDPAADPPQDPNAIVVLADDDDEFDITEPQYEYGIVVEDHDGFPEEGYVQIGDEVLAYQQDRHGGTVIWRATVPVWDEKEGKWVDQTVSLLTGIKHFRQRYGTARAKYLEYPRTHGSALQYVDPETPPESKDATAKGYWTDHEKHIVQVREFRYHDRLPQREPKLAELDTPAKYVGKFAPHHDDSRLAYYEFAITLPGAVWTRVQWNEMLYRRDDSVGGEDDQLGIKPLNDDDPFDVKVLVQIDGSPGWDDMTLDPNVEPSLGRSLPVSTPVHWHEFPEERDDAYNDDYSSLRPKKPIVFLFDEAFDPNVGGKHPDNFINPWLDGSERVKRGQAGDRIRVRVFFQYKPGEDGGHKAPDYSIPWRTPWVDTIILSYRAPTHVFEHREMPY